MLSRLLPERTYCWWPPSGPSSGTSTCREVRQLMRGSAVVDARNLLNGKDVEKVGLSYAGVGR